jgi:cobyrinic acid a,c-diamide synthase
MRGHGVDGSHDGIVYRNVLASYAHLRSGCGSDWAAGFVDFVRKNKIGSKAQDGSANVEPAEESSLAIEF